MFKSFQTGSNGGQAIEIPEVEVPRVEIAKVRGDEPNITPEARATEFKTKIGKLQEWLKQQNCGPNSLIVMEFELLKHGKNEPRNVTVSANKILELAPDKVFEAGLVYLDKLVDGGQFGKICLVKSSNSTN